MNRRLVAVFAALVAGCAAPPAPHGVDPSISGPLAQSADPRKPPAPQLEQALIPPLRMEMPQAGGQPIDGRFDLSVSNAPAAQVFSSLVAGTRYSMLVHPSVTGDITVNMKDVTMREALDSIRDLYGYEYKIDGMRILIQPAGVQTRVFQVNYLSGQRRGMSQVRVTSNSQVEGGTTGTGGTAGTTGASGAGGPGGTGTGASGGAGATNRESARVTTNQEATFWSDLCEALVALTFPDNAGAAASSAGTQPEDRQRSICNRRHPQSDRSIVVSPHSGVVVIRATPAELRAVESYLRASRIAVERQVMLEAKIIEVTLSSQFQSGINWAAFNTRVAVGQVGQVTPTLGTTTALSAGVPSVATSQLLGASGPTGSVFGLAVAASNFAALITFLESQGNVQVLSSPRVATLNNQKAVLKVGDELLAISQVSVTPGTPASVGVAGTQATVTPQFTPYFSGIVLDVTPQIDDSGNITLHIHPSINSLSPNNVTVTLVQGTNPVDVPTVKSTIREADTIVRVTDGNIVAIGGLMRTEVSDNRAGLPGVSDSGLFGFLFRSTNRVTEKKELVILLKPTIIDSDRVWAEDLRETRGRFDALGRQSGGAKEAR
jgi:MSHA biogenesis protein MshL